jgi:glycosyltransferase involved in cell wall biosynthesis
MADIKSVLSNFQGNFTSKVLPIPPTLADFIWNKLHVLPVEKILGNLDVYHTSDWSEPPASAFKVTTVHDLYPIKFPKLIHRQILETHRRKLSWVLQESKRVIVPSISTKNDLIQIGAREDIIRVIPEASSIKKADSSMVIETKKKYGINGDYLISIGITPLKNTENIIKAFHLAKPGKEVKLVLVGRPINLSIEEERNVRILGHVPHNDLAALLTGSGGLVFPSIYEGFGLPILDAFACEAPVVTSNISAMAEVAGDAAVLVDPYDISSIADGIEKILRGKKGLVEKGLKRASQFSWEETAKKTLEVYNESRS